ncbi:hypothetical protein SpCBS45565_g04162 [Spizellomyces sp. 'palustris']|nr:hypothetical protein SpCBS45565_g04162 [Spizellomyces sp. 'palustris']
MTTFLVLLAFLSALPTIYGAVPESAAVNNEPTDNSLDSEMQGIPLPDSILDVASADGTTDESGPCKRGVKSWFSPDFGGNWANSWNFVKDSYGKQNRGAVVDPTGGSKDLVLEITYPAGSRNPGGKIVGGTGFYAKPIDLSNAKSVSLSYQVLFPKGFNFVKGGKLPGLYGGHPSCSGGNKALDCFSTRFMFRTSGLGEIYLYVDRNLQDSSFCKVKPVTLCNPTYGASMGRGAYHFTPGSWTAVSQTVVLNSFTNGKPNQDGKVTVYANGKKVIEFTKAVFTPDPKIGFEGLDFETFFGGNDNSWATPTTQRAYFKEFVISAL